MKSIVKALSKERSSEFNSWFYLICCIKNICSKSGIEEEQQYNSIHTFSALSNNYDYNDAGGYGYNNIKKDSVMGVKNNPVNVINYYYDQETMKNIRGPSYANPYLGN